MCVCEGERESACVCHAGRVGTGGSVFDCWLMHMVIHVRTGSNTYTHTRPSFLHAHLHAVGGGVGVELPLLVLEALGVGLRALRLLPQQPHVCHMIDMVRVCM